MKVIDLLVKIVNEESVPKTIKVYGHKYQYAKDIKDYKAEDIEKYWLISNFIEDYLDLKEEVEIIEDSPEENKKIEPIKEEVWQLDRAILKNKINEIIDKVNGE